AIQHERCNVDISIELEHRVTPSILNKLNSIGIDGEIENPVQADIRIAIAPQEDDSLVCDVELARVDRLQHFLSDALHIHRARSPVDPFGNANSSRWATVSDRARLGAALPPLRWRREVASF